MTHLGLTRRRQRFTRRLKLCLGQKQCCFTSSKRVSCSRPKPEPQITDLHCCRGQCVTLLLRTLIDEESQIDAQIDIFFGIVEQNVFICFPFGVVSPWLWVILDQWETGFEDWTWFLTHADKKVAYHISLWYWWWCRECLWWLWIKKKKIAIINWLLPAQWRLTGAALSSTCGGALLGLRVSGVKTCAAVDSMKVGSLIWGLALGSSCWKTVFSLFGAEWTFL